MKLFDLLKKEEIALAEQYLKPLRFPRGACIFRQGDPGDGCYLIDKGTVRIEVNVDQARDTVLGYLEPGMWLGEFSLIDGKARSAAAYAHTDVEARWFPDSSYRELCSRHPRIGLYILTGLSRDLVQKVRKVNLELQAHLSAAGTPPEPGPSGVPEAVQGKDDRPPGVEEQVLWDIIRLLLNLRGTSS